MKNLLLFSIGLLLSGCSTADIDLFGERPLNIEQPVVHFVHPESGGKLGKGRVLIGMKGGSAIEVVNNLDDNPVTTDPHIENTVMATGVFEIGLIPHLDFYAEHGTGLKLQVLGDTRANATPGNFSMSLAYEVIPDEFEATSEDDTGTVKKATGTVTQSGYNAQVIFGYRKTENTMIYGGPFYSFTSADKVHIKQEDSTSTVFEGDVNTGEATTYGGNLGIFRENSGGIFGVIHFTFGGAIGYGKTTWKKTWPGQEEEKSHDLWSGGMFIGFVW